MVSLMNLDRVRTETVPQREEAVPMQERTAGLGAARFERPAAEVLAERLAEDIDGVASPFLIP